MAVRLVPRQRSRSRTVVLAAGLALLLTMVVAGWYRVSYEAAAQECSYDAPDNVTEASNGWQNWPPGFTCDWTYHNGQVQRHFVDLFPSPE